MTLKDLGNDIIINKNDVLNTNVNFFDQYYPGNSWVKENNEHYKLLTYLTKRYNDIVILDIGTREGCSCLALAQNPSNQVISYDITRYELPYQLNNASIRIMNIHQENLDTLKSSSIILLDIDPHDGIQEQEFINKLKSIEYNGIVICDDIHKGQMQQWWNDLDIERYDITDIGHCSGTGLINFTKNKIIFQ